MTNYLRNFPYTVLGSPSSYMTLQPLHQNFLINEEFFFSSGGPSQSVRLLKIWHETLTQSCSAGSSQNERMGDTMKTGWSSQAVKIRFRLENGCCKFKIIIEFFVFLNPIWKLNKTFWLFWDQKTKTIYVLNVSWNSFLLPNFSGMLCFILSKSSKNYALYCTVQYFPARLYCIWKVYALMQYKLHRPTRTVWRAFPVLPYSNKVNLNLNCHSLVWHIN